MKTFLIGASTVIAIAAILVTIATPHGQTAPLANAPAASVSAGGFTLASVSVDLPGDDAMFPAGPHADVINANCTSCHSASMALTQPALSADQWTAEVTKMREVYRAPVAEADVPAIVGYLTRLSTSRGVPATGKAQNPDQKAAPRISGGT